MSPFPATVILLGLCAVAMFIGQLMNLSLAKTLVEGFGVTRKALEGEWWRLIIGPFMHAGPGHLFGNVAMLFIAGMGCEHAFGPARTLAIFLLSALAGSVLGVFFNAMPSIGISGAVFGIIAALIAFLSKNEDWVHVRDKRIGVVFAVWAAYSFATGLLSPVVDNFAHLGGFLMGAAMGIFWADAARGAAVET